VDPHAYKSSLLQLLGLMVGLRVLAYLIMSVRMALK
jgi:hypothetical protein